MYFLKVVSANFKVGTIELLKATTKLKGDIKKMKLTKQIEITNIFNEVVTVQPINYNLAIVIAELTQEVYLATDKVKDVFLKLYEQGIENIKDHPEMKNIIKLSDDMHKEEKDIREKFNYYYVGFDNLDIEDIQRLTNKYSLDK